VSSETVTVKICKEEEEEEEEEETLKLYQSIFTSPSVPIFRKLRNIVELGFNIMKWTEY
jgi:hypothetical protein